MRITKRLIDRLAQIDSEIATLKAEADQIKTELKTKGDGTYDGFDFFVEIQTVSTTTLDQKAIKALLEPAQIAQCLKSGTRTNVYIRPRVAVAA
jgi:hypothetical protein